MTTEIVTIPCLSDNYAYLIHDKPSGETAVVDVPEAGPILDALNDRGWTLSHVLITHHHYDHIDGVKELLAHAPAKVIGARADAHRLPPLDIELDDGGRFQFGAQEVQVMDVSGHTIGHIAFYFPQSAAVFTADSLMALGCGRLFEGNPAQMWGSLSKLMALPPETQVFSGHEYTESNARFALTIDPNNSALILRKEEITKALEAGQPTVPSRLDQEILTNPFLRPDNPEIRRGLGMENASNIEVFAEIRARKDRF